MDRPIKLGRPLCAAAILLLSGCSIDPSRLTDQQNGSANVSDESAADSERQALRDLTHALALALGEEATRNDLKTALRNAPFAEHKLEFRKYLTADFVERIPRARGVTPQRLMLALQTVRSLEMYMPIAAHRARWSGGADLLVASQLEDGDTIVAFNLKGEEVFLSRDTPPTIPTISIVSAETRFDMPLDLTKWQNVNDLDGRAIGTMVSCEMTPAQCLSRNAGIPVRSIEECEYECEGGGGGGSSGSFTPGLYMTFSRIVDKSEDWTRGDPEIEVHVHGPASTLNPQYGANLACSGEHALPERTFDQDLAFWNGNVLIWSQAQGDQFNAQFSDGHNVLFWEDDDTPCVIRLDHNTLYNALAQTAAAVGGAALKMGGFGGVGLALVAATFLASVFENADWLMSDDDFLGALVTESSYGVYYSDANYTLLKGNRVNGRAQIIGR